MRARVVGRLGRDAESVVIKDNDYLKISVGESVGKGKTIWVECLLTALYQAERLRKGALVIVEGNLSAKAYVNKGGELMVDWTIWASSAEVLIGGKKREDSDVLPADDDIF